jgi:hypothetical protein
MATYVNDLRLKEIATGDEAGTWGTSTNTNLELIAEAFSFGTEAITTNADTHTTTIADGSTDPGRSIFLKYTGTLDSACTITIGPNTVSKLWFIENATSGSQNIIISQGSGASITIPNGHVKAIYSDGAGSGAAMVDAFTDLNVAGDFFVGDDLTLLSDAAVLGFGADTDTTLTHVADTGILLNSTRQLQFGDSGTYIHQSADGVLDLVSDTELELNATTIDMNGNLDLSGTLNGISILADATNFTESILISQNASTGTLDSASNNTGLGDSVFAALTSGDNNTAVGVDALIANTSGTNNVAVGQGSLDANTTASNNTALGTQTLSANTTGASNVAVGFAALEANTTASNNTAVGMTALLVNTTGSSNVAVGQESLFDNTTGGFNTAIGKSALENNTTASNNTAVGYTALLANTTGIENVAVGSGCLIANTTGNYNTAMGNASLDANDTGGLNVAIGNGALSANTSANNNTAVGTNALLSNTTGADNTAVGTFCMDANTTGVDNVAVGSEALTSNTTASHNTAVGYRSLQQNTTGQYNSGFGKYALQNNTTASNNTAVGYASLGANTTGADNVAVGRHSADANTTGYSNVAVGESSLTSNTTGYRNTAIGKSALENCTTGTENTIVGMGAGGDLTTGAANVAVGQGALPVNTTGSSNTCVGINAGISSTTGSNNTLLGKDAGRSGSPGGPVTTDSNVVALGDENVSSLHCQTALTVSSDQRDKTDFSALNVGLDFVKQLQPYTYKWDKRSKYGNKYADDYDLNAQTPDGTHKEDWLDVGFKAQDVETLEKAAGFNIDNKTNLTVSLSKDGKQYALKYEKFIPILVKGLQELSAQVEELKNKLNEGE